MSHGGHCDPKPVQVLCWKAGTAGFLRRTPGRAGDRPHGPVRGGKTTLLRILMGLERPDGGTIDGLAGLRLSAVFQEDRLCDNLDPSANIRLINPTLGRRETEDALAAVGLAGCLRQPARELSGGMRRPGGDLAGTAGGIRPALPG